MKFYIYENSKIPQYLSWFIDIWAITLYPFIICRGKLDLRTKNHEIIHLHQQRELWIVGFYLLYVLFWIHGLLKLKSFHAAYRSIPFEKEAYEHEEDFTHTLNRKNFIWVKYLRNKESLS